jgi:hypothetical protein
MSLDKEQINLLKEREKEILEEINFFDHNFHARTSLEEELYEIVDTLKRLGVKNETRGETADKNTI